MSTASSSSSAAAAAVIPQNNSISIKLTDGNYLIWKQQILATVRGYGLEPFLTGESIKPPRLIQSPDTQEMQQNPEFLVWTRQDQLLSAWIQSSLSESIMILVVGLSTSQDIWNTLEVNFSSQSRAKLMQYKLQLQTLKKESLPMREYLSKVKTCCDNLASAGYLISDDDQILHILAGLGSEYDSIMVTVTSRAESWKVQDVHALLLSFESRLDNMKSVAVSVDGSQPAANLAQNAPPRNNNNHNTGSGGRGGYNNNKNRNGGRGTGFGSRGRGGRGRSSGNRPTCQVCQVPGHTADRCWYRFEQNFVPQNQQPRHQQQPQQASFQQHNYQPHHALNVAQAPAHPGPPSQSEYSYDSSLWFPDAGATNHVSNDFNNLNSAAEYHGGHQGHPPQGHT